MRAPKGGGIALPLAITFAVQAMVALAIYGAPVMAPVAAPALGVSASAVGYYIAAAYFGSMLSSAVAGGWLARFGPIRISQIGLMLCLAGLLLSASAWVPLVLLGGFVVGLGYGPATPASSVILVHAAPREIFSLVFSIKQTGVPAGGVLAGLLVPMLVLSLGWQWGAAVIGVACLALALAIQPARALYDTELKPDARIALASAFAPVAMVLRVPALRVMCISSFVYGGVQIAMVTYLVSFVIEDFGLSLVAAGALMSASQVASVVGRIGWGLLADRALGRRVVLGILGIGMGLSALASLAASPAWPAWLLVAYASVFGATAVGWNGVFLAEVARIAPEGRTSEATGGCLFFTFLGVVLTPLLFNGVFTLTGSYPTSFAVFAVPALWVGVWMLARMPAR